MIEKPYELSFMAVYDLEGNLIWEEHPKITDIAFAEVIAQAKELYNSGEIEGEQLIELSDGTKFYTHNMSSPLPLIN